MKLQIALGLAAVLSTRASVVSWNFDRNGTVTGSAIAGVSPAANWNNSWPANPVTDLIDSDGQPTTLDIAYTSFNTWSIQDTHPGVDGDGSSNKELLNGYLNAGPAEWNPAIITSSVTLSQIPYPNYDVIVYFSSDGADREGTVSDGITTYYFKTLGAASIGGSNATLVGTADTTAAGYATGANYAIFSAVSGASRTLTVQMRDNDEWGGIAGIQVVARLGSVPQFAVHPESQTVAVGSTVRFIASAAADPAPAYQWQYSIDGTSGWIDLEGRTDPGLIFSPSLDDEGYYRVIATNSTGSATSDPAQLTVIHSPPHIITPPAANTYAVEGSKVELEVSATGYETLTYQWYKDNAELGGQTSDKLVLSNVSSATAGVYTVKITDSVQADLTATTDPANVFVFPAWNGLVSHDPFDSAAGYTLGELPLQSPAVTGYTGAWTDIDFGDAEPEVIAGPLTYADPLYAGSTGDHAGKAADTAGITTANSGRTYRKLAPALAVAANTTGTRYLSWLYRNGNENIAANATTHAVLSLYQDSGGAVPSGDAARRSFEAGISDADFGNTNFGFRVDDSMAGDLIKPIDGNVHLLVAKFELGATGNADSVTVWIDPVLGAGDPASGGVAIHELNLEFDSLALSDYSSNSVAWDEVRWGSSFDSVTLPATPNSSFATWIAGYPGVGALGGFNDDADHDGLANGVEYYFGSNPATPGTGISQVAKSGNTITFQHPQGPSPAGGVNAAYLWSSDLATWHASGTASNGTTVTLATRPDSPSAGATTVTATISGTLPARLFIRLQVAPSP